MHLRPPLSSPPKALTGPSEAAPSALEEAAEVRRASADSTSFAALYRRHQPHIARYVRRRVGDRDAADDLVAETFTIALGRLGRYRDRGLGFRGWLYGIASNVIRSWIRRSGRRRHAALEDAAEPTVDGREVRADEAEEARAALLTLPARYQTTLALHYLEELSVDEVAAVMGCRPGTVKARLSRGRALLKDQLEARNREVQR